MGGGEGDGIILSVNGSLVHPGHNAILGNIIDHRIGHACGDGQGDGLGGLLGGIALSKIQADVISHKVVALDNKIDGIGHGAVFQHGGIDAANTEFTVANGNGNIVGGEGLIPNIDGLGGS